MWASGVKVAGGFESYAKAAMLGNTSVNSSTWTKLPFSAVQYDNLDEVDTVTNHRWDAAADGFYRITALAFLQGLGSTEGLGAILMIYKNGVGLDRSPAGHSLSASDNSLVCITTISRQLVAGDYIEVFLWHNGPGALTSFNPAQYCTIERFA